MNLSDDFSGLLMRAEASFVIATSFKSFRTIPHRFGVGIISDYTVVLILLSVQNHKFE